MTAIDPTLEQIVLAHIRKGRKDLMGLAILTAAFAALPFIMGIAQDKLTGGRIGLGIVLLVIAGLLFWNSKKDPATHPIFTLLRDRPKDAVWVYVSTTRQGAGTVSSQIMIGTVDKRRYQVNAAIGNEQELLQAIARALPWATVGFSPELEQKFNANPDSLRRV